MKLRKNLEAENISLASPSSKEMPKLAKRKYETQKLGKDRIRIRMPTEPMQSSTTRPEVNAANAS